jgi:putative endopeptidase
MNKTTKLAYLIPLVFGFLPCHAQKEPGINPQLMDTKISPANDFFRYVNGAWVDKTDIPADRARWGSFDELRQRTDDDVLAILREASAGNKYNSKTDQGKAINLYSSVMDTLARDKAGIKPLKPYLAKINAVKNTKDLQKLMMEMEPVGGIGFFGIGVRPDAKDSNKNLIQVSPGSVGLPDRDYYVSDDADSKEKRQKYVAHVTKMLQYLGDSPVVAKANAEKILALETALSEPRLTRVERRDARNTYNPKTLAELQVMTPAIDWNKFLAELKMPTGGIINVSQPKYMAALQTVFTNAKIDDWKAYMRWTLLNRTASRLSTEIEDANWEFYGKTLGGASKQRPTDERALQVVNGSIGEALGKLYVEKKFPAEAKSKAHKMIQNVIAAYETRINNLSWMNAVTKKAAVEKLKKINIKIGYPDNWRDYSAMVVGSKSEGSDYFNNMENIARWRFDEDLKDLQKPVDKSRWGMSPQTVNAYYNASFNEIVFPAAILQPPFYNYQADEAVNYGGIGAVIGHEISHGFDDSGARYNAEGNLINWWSDEDLKQFTALGSALADQYSALEPLPGTFVDGKYTLGENIGDLGGVNSAYDGLMLHLQQNGDPGLIDGFTPQQRFFISWATVWRSKMRDEAIKNMVKTDPHSPGMYRAYVPLQNVDAFYEAFGIKPGDGMYIEPGKRVKIW